MKAKILIVGGSGFISGTLARLALECGHQVWTVTRGLRELPRGVVPLVADRHYQAGFARAIADAGTDWDMVVDCIAYEPADIRQDVEVLRQRARRLVFISTEAVYDPNYVQFPQSEMSDHYLQEGYGGLKRQSELELIRADTGEMRWVALRVYHVVGPGSWLGCIPAHGRDPQLIERLLSHETLRLLYGGHMLHQPLYAPDLAETALSALGNDRVHREIIQVMGPDVIESRRYYQIIADELGVELKIEELTLAQYQKEHPERPGRLCHKFFDLSKLHASGLAVPRTPIEDALRVHVRSLRST